MESRGILDSSVADLSVPPPSPVPLGAGTMWLSLPSGLLPTVSDLQPQ